MLLLLALGAADPVVAYFAAATTILTAVNLAMTSCEQYRRLKPKKETPS